MAVNVVLPVKLATVSATTTVVDTVSDTPLFTYTIPAGTLKAGDVLRLSLWGDCLNNSAASRIYTNYLKLAGTTIITAAMATAAASATRRNWFVDALLSVRVAASDTQCYMSTVFSAAVASGTAGANLDRKTGIGAATTDFTSADRTITYNVVHATNHASLDQRALGGALVLFKA